jgi:diguanylate cyclase (GGDEF)-like protein
LSAASTAEAQLERTDSSAFLLVLKNCLIAAGRSEHSLALLIIELENLDRLASVFGHRRGEQLVTVIASRLSSAVRDQDRLLRIGDRRFAVVIDPLSNLAILDLAAGKFFKQCSRAVVIDGDELSAIPRIGIAVASGESADPEVLLQNAETALLAAAADGKPHTVFSPEQIQRVADPIRLEAELDAAIKRKDFQLHFQPKISTHDFQPNGAEALIRWDNALRGMVSPDVFIPLAECAGRREPLTAFVLNSALRYASNWPVSLSVSVNVSPRMLLTTELVDLTQSALRLWDFPPRRLYLEITEGALMTDPDVSFDVLTQLRQLGVRISIDDFGTGFSSLAYFKNIPADELKIDKSFVLNMLEDEGDKRIVRAIIQLSKQFGLAVTAEGVEDEQTALMLAELNCDSLQGFHFSRPLPAQAFESWLAAGNRTQAT